MRPIRLALVGLLTVATTLLVVPPASAKWWSSPKPSTAEESRPGGVRLTPAPDSWAVAGDATVTLRGHGYGHGHGMSQYGAEGAARTGRTYREIAGFYYPGTTWGTAPGRVRVLIGAATSDDLVVRPRAGLTVRDTVGRDRVLLPDNGATAWRVAVARSGRDRVSYRTDRWHRWKDLAGHGELDARGAPITMLTPAGERAYRGRLRLVPPAPGSTARDTVNDLSLERYLRGVVPLEMPASWSTEALRAQAVAARTYAAYERAHPRARHYQLCDSTSCQVYGGVAAEQPSTTRAVADTAGQVLLSAGAPAFTQFGSSSGGWTSAGSAPYLPAQADPWDDWSGNTVHDWTVRLSDRALERVWPAIGDLTRIAVTRRDGHGDWGGRVRTVVLTGTRGSVTVDGDTFRSRLGLRSTYLTFSVSAG